MDRRTFIGALQGLLCLLTFGYAGSKATATSVEEEPLFKEPGVFDGLQETSDVVLSYEISVDGLLSGEFVRVSGSGSPAEASMANQKLVDVEGFPDIGMGISHREMCVGTNYIGGRIKSAWLKEEDVGKSLVVRAVYRCPTRNKIVAMQIKDACLVSYDSDTKEFVWSSCGRAYTFCPVEVKANWS